VNPADERALAALSYEYASAVDRRSPDDFVGLFAADARLAVGYPPNPPEREYVGHAELATIPVSSSAYDTTFHFVAQATYDHVDSSSDTAAGVVYSVAHHLERNRHGGLVFVMYIRYLDRYERSQGRWRFSERRLAVEWSESRCALPASFRRGT
jgi:hypothetical protein